MYAYGGQPPQQQQHHHSHSTHSTLSSASPGYGSSGSRHRQQPHAGQQYQQGPPPGVDPQLWQWFSAVDLDRSGAISVTELQTALVNGELDMP